MSDSQDIQNSKKEQPAAKSAQRTEHKLLKPIVQGGTPRKPDEQVSLKPRQVERLKKQGVIA